MASKCLRNIVLVIGVAALVCTAYFSGLATAISPHVVQIDSDAALAALSRGTGTGTEDDPYVIEGLDIDAKGEGSCIRIANTTAFFILRRSTFTGAGTSAISLENVHNGWIVECVIENNKVGVTIDAESSDITFTLNTFRGNATDVIDHSQSTSWDDGYVGNWWDSYEGIDENGDGIGDTTYKFPLHDPQQTQGTDRHPLVKPFVGGKAPDPGTVRLEVKYNTGDVFEYTLTTHAHIEITTGFFPVVSDAESEMVLSDEVNSAAVHDIYDLQETVIKDTGRVTVNGMAQPYKSSLGTVSKPQIHRFGSMVDLGNVISNEKSYGLGTPVQFPVRYIGVGYTWTSEWTMGADALGVPEGNALYRATYTLDHFEEWNGQQCAVINAHVDATVKGKEEDPFSGTVLYDGTISLDATAFVDLSNGRTVTEKGSLKMIVNILSGSGGKIGQITMNVTVEAADKHEITSATTVTFNQQVADLQAQLTDIRSQYDSQIADLQSQLKQVKAALAALQEASAAPLRIAYLNTEDAFSVFTDAVSDLRQKAFDKKGEIVKLQQQYMAGAISKDDFDSQNNQLQVELLQAQLNIDLGAIDKMLASPGFSDMKSDLQRLKDQAQPVVDEMKNLISTVRVGGIDKIEFQTRYTQVKNAFTQLDQLLTQAATAKIMQAANKVAVAQGYDLVLCTKNVIVYRNTAKIIDITDMVKRELASYL